MINDREEGHEEHEESEYHFSDEDVSYDVDDEAAKPAATPPVAKKPSLVSRLPNARRMVIGGIVFVLLLVVIYRMLTPAATTPSTDIKPIQTITTTVATKPAAQPVMPVNTPAVTVTTSTTAPAVAPAQPAAPAVIPSTPMTATTTTTQVPGAITSAPPAAPTTQQVQPMPAQPIVSSPPPAPVATATDPASILQAENARLAGQLQVEYTQKLAEFSAQNQLLRDQVSALTSKVETLSNQLSQMVNQTVTKTTVTTATDRPLPRIPYTVQAIIPGRAWLKSDSGETVTVAEGDVLKSYGRVTKIDPYDGLVEITVGNKTVVLSYGNGG